MSAGTKLWWASLVGSRSSPASSAPFLSPEWAPVVRIPCVLAVSDAHSTTKTVQSPRSSTVAVASLQILLCLCLCLFPLGGSMDATVVLRAVVLLLSLVLLPVRLIPVA